MTVFRIRARFRCDVPPSNFPENTITIFFLQQVALEHKQPQMLRKQLVTPLKTDVFNLKFKGCNKEKGLSFYVRKNDVDIEL